LSWRRRSPVGILHDEEEGEDHRQSIPYFDNGDDHTYWSVSSSDRAVAQVVISRLVTTEALVQFQISSCGIYGGRNGTGAGSSLLA